MNLAPLEAFVAARLGHDSTGHDHHHCQRVRHLAERLASLENMGDPIVISCAALLHDIPDPKVCTDPSSATLELTALLESNGVDADRIRHILEIIATLSFKGAGVDTPMSTIEGKLVQDADRLDALGAIGIARCFACGAVRGNALYDPDERPTVHDSEAAYRSHRGSSVSHFHEKLLLLKDRMQTAAGRELAARRHRFMADFLRQFLAEWEMND
jgi:uncharacterized protein